MNEQEIESKLSKIQNPEPLDRDFRLNLKKRLMNQLQYQQNEELRMRQSNLQAGQNHNQRHTKAGFFGRLGLSGIVFSLFMVFSLSSVMAYYSFPSVKTKINHLVGIQEKGQVDITTLPDNADVFLNGTSSGQTPFKKDLAVGNYTLKITKDGYKNYFQSITIKKDETTTLDIDLEVAAPVDDYENWLVYNNTEKGFGFRYPGDWKINEDEANSTNQDQFIVNLTNSFANIAITQTQTKPQSLATDTVSKKLQLDNCTFTVGLDDSGLENAKDTDFYCVMNQGPAYLIVSAQITTQGGIAENSQEYKDLKNMLASVWLDKQSATSQGYKQPKTNVTPKFVWQQGNTVYNMGVTGNLPVSHFAFKDSQIGTLSPDYKWILFNEASGISIIDNEGKNRQKLINLPTSSNNIYVNASVEKGSWSPDMHYFVYLLSIQSCFAGGSDECDVNFLDQGLGFKGGLYIFNLKTGVSTYIQNTKDAANNGASVNWSADSKSLYYIKDGDAKGKVVVDEYSTADLASTNGALSGLSSPKSYTMDTGTPFYSVQMDVYDRDNVVILGGPIGKDCSIDLARFADGKIEIVKNLKKNIAWTEMQWPRFSQYKQFIIVNGPSYYNLEKNAWVDLNGSDKNKYNFVAYTTSYAVLAGETVNSMNEAVPMTLRVVDIAFNKEWKVVWTDKTVDKNNSNDFVDFPAAD